MYFPYFSLHVFTMNYHIINECFLQHCVCLHYTHRYSGDSSDQHRMPLPASMSNLTISKSHIDTLALAANKANKNK